MPPLPTYAAPPHHGDTRFIRFFSFLTRQDKPVIPVDRPIHNGISVSPDRRYLLFDEYDESGSDLMLVEDIQGQLR